jgi:mono/diheme cytochrome c family protein
VRGRIYRIVYRGGPGANDAKVTPCPDLTAPPEAVVVTNPAGGARSAAAPDATTLLAPNGATQEMVLLGDRIYHGQVGGAACTGCHGVNGAGTTLGPDLTDSQWLWSDGSFRGITMTISAGVMQPKNFRAPMPPMGGAQLSADQVSAVAAYVWGLSHH